MQQVLAAVDPWGDERADLRAAHTTLFPMTGDFDREEAFDHLRNYLKINQDD